LNWRRGLFRLWMVLSIGWVIIVGYADDLPCAFGVRFSAPWCVGYGHDSDYVELFKRLRGSELKSAIYTALQFGKFGNSSESMKRIVAIASDALRQIARESTINARRVRMYGVTVDSPPGEQGKTT
jgi:hypothetical protein